MLLHTYEWGDADAPALLCLHGVTGHGERFRRLAEQRWSKRFRVIAPDLRGHGRSEWEPPWTFETHVADIVETLDALGVEQADVAGHSFGGRLVLELAAAHPERLRRAVLLDPAIQILPHVALAVADLEHGEKVYASAAEYADDRGDGPMTPRELVLEDAGLHCDVRSDGMLVRRTCQSAAVSIYCELASAPPPPDTLTVPTLLIYAPAYGLVWDEQVEAYADRAQVMQVPGMHMVIWDAEEAVGEAVEGFLT